MAGIIAAASIGSWAGKCVVSFPIASCVDDARARGVHVIMYEYNQTAS